MGVLLGLGVAVAYGGADFLGGFTSRRSATGSVVFLSQFVGLLVALAFSLGFGGDPDGHDLLLGVGAGLAGVVGVSALYRGLAIGRMGVVAPITAVVNAIIPIAWGIGRGERPSALALSGVALALLAVVVIAREPDVAGDAIISRSPPQAPAPPLQRSAEPPSPLPPASRRVQVALGVVAGIGFGVGLVCFAETGSDSGLWPGFTARCTTVPLVALVLLVGRRVLLPHPADRLLVAAGGTLDTSANAFQLLAVREGLLSLVAPVASLYPAGTVLLARLVLHESIGRARLFGLGIALMGLVLIAV